MEMSSGSSVGRLWEESRLYGAPSAFASKGGFLLDEPPRVVQLRSSQLLELKGLGGIAPPTDYGKSHSEHSLNAEPAMTFNPSITRAPSGLCPRCTYAVSLRVDTLHQCSTASSPYTSGKQLTTNSWFQGSAIGILDDQLRMLGWTWLLNSPEYQVASSDVNESVARRAGCTIAGDSDAFPPVWAKQTYDARLLHVDGELLVTYACSSCVWSLSPLRVTAEPTADGGFRQLRAWATDRVTYQHWPWLAGRNQALFLHEPPKTLPHSPGRGVRPAASRLNDGGRTEISKRRDAMSPLTGAEAGGEEDFGRRARGASLWVQSRLGLVGRLGWPRFERQRAVRCDVPSARRSGRLPLPEKCHGDRKAIICGSSPLHASVTPRTLKGVRASDAKLFGNSTAKLPRALRPAGTFGGLSLTSNLVHVRRQGADGHACKMYLGVGHLHRGEGEINRRLYRRQRSSSPPWERAASSRPIGRHPRLLRRRQPFAFGYRYTHFFYALAPQPPFATIAASGEFCIGSLQDATDCESVQFISGLALREATRGGSGVGGSNASTLLLAYGSNDCEARLGTMLLSQVLEMLQPIPLLEEGVGHPVCS